MKWELEQCRGVKHKKGEVADRGLAHDQSRGRELGDRNAWAPRSWALSAGPSGRPSAGTLGSLSISGEAQAGKARCLGKPLWALGPSPPSTPVLATPHPTPPPPTAKNERLPSGLQGRCRVCGASQADPFCFYSQYLKMAWSSGCHRSLRNSQGCGEGQESPLYPTPTLHPRRFPGVEPGETYSS